MIKMEHEEMKAVFMRQNERYIRDMKNVRDVDIRKGLYMSSRGALFLASLLCLVDEEEQMVLLDGLERCMYPEFDLLPFEEVPAEEQETFEIDDLPFPEVMEKSPEESEEPEIEKIQKLFKEQYDEYIVYIQEESDNVNMCRYMYQKCCGLLDFASRLGLVDFAEHMDLCKGLEEARKIGVNSFEVVTGFGDYIDVEVAASIVEQQYDLTKHNIQEDNFDEEDLHFMHGYMRCAADVGVIPEDMAEGLVTGLTNLYEEKDNIFRNEYGNMDMCEIFAKVFGFVPKKWYVHECITIRSIKCKANKKVYVAGISRDGKVVASVYSEGEANGQLDIESHKTYEDAKDLLEVQDV